MLSCRYIGSANDGIGLGATVPALTNILIISLRPSPQYVGKSEKLLNVAVIALKISYDQNFKFNSHCAKAQLDLRLSWDSVYSSSCSNMVRWKWHEFFSLFRKGGHVHKYVPQIANPQICVLIFFRFAELKLPHLRNCDLRICDLLNFRFSDPIIFCGLTTSANPQIHNLCPYKYELKI